MVSIAVRECNQANAHKTHFQSLPITHMSLQLQGVAECSNAVKSQCLHKGADKINGGQDL